jgi:hypothetical protein
MRVIVQPLLNELISTAIAIPKAKEVTVGTALKGELVRLHTARRFALTRAILGIDFLAQPYPPAFRFAVVRLNRPLGSSTARRGGKMKIQKADLHYHNDVSRCAAHIRESFH